MSTPPLFERDDNGLIKGFTYHFDALNRIDWKKHLLPTHLYVSPDYQDQVMVRQNVKTKWDVDVTKCEDKELLVTLAGLKYLARLRGIDAVRVHDLHVSPTEVTSVCSIQFSPNYENPEGLTVEAQASASLYSVSGKFQLYLAAFAQNRAFTRAAKDGLGIEILGFEEVDFKASKAFENALKEGHNPLAANTAAPKTESDNTPIPAGFHGPAVLARMCSEINKNGSHSFDKIKAQAIKTRDELAYVTSQKAADEYEAKKEAGEKVEGEKPMRLADIHDPVNWVDWESISPGDSWVLIGKIREAAEKKASKKVK